MIPALGCQEPSNLSGWEVPPPPRPRPTGFPLGWSQWKSGLHSIGRGDFWVPAATAEIHHPCHSQAKRGCPAQVYFSHTRLGHHAPVPPPHTVLQVSVTTGATKQVHQSSASGALATSPHQGLPQGHVCGWPPPVAKLEGGGRHSSNNYDGPRTEAHKWTVRPGWSSLTCPATHSCAHRCLTPSVPGAPTSTLS